MSKKQGQITKQIQTARTHESSNSCSNTEDLKNTGTCSKMFNPNIPHPRLDSPSNGQLAASMSNQPVKATCGVCPALPLRCSTPDSRRCCAERPRALEHVQGDFNHAVSQKVKPGNKKSSDLHCSKLFRRPMSFPKELQQKAAVEALIEELSSLSYVLQVSQQLVPVSTCWNISLPLPFFPQDQHRTVAPRGQMGQGQRSNMYI